MKLLLTALCLFITMNASALDIKSADLYGKWLCGMTYDEISLGTMDATDLKEDGTFESYGIAETPIEKPVLHYRSKSSGTWVLKDGHLILTVKENHVRRDFSEKAKAMLEKNPQAKAMEQSLFEALSSNDEQGDEIDFRLLNFDPDKFSYEQRIGEHKFYGGCKR